MMNTCSKCGKEKPLDAFHKQKGRQLGLRSQCKCCHNAKVRECEKTEQGKKVRRNKQRRMLQTDKFKKRNKERSLRIYYSDPEYYRMKQRSRYHGVAVGIIKEVYDRDKVCQMCGTNTNLTIDHMHPHSRGGIGAIDNLQLLCRSCNGWKSDRLVLPGGGVML